MLDTFRYYKKVVRQKNQFPFFATLSSKARLKKMSEHGNKARRRWTEEEDNNLRRLVAAAGENDVVWRDVATQMEARNSNQCRERWTNHLRPGIRRGNWSVEEDETIERLQKEIGNQWSAIASKLDRRTDIDVKNRYHTLQRKRKSSEAMLGLGPKVGQRVLVKFEEDKQIRLYDGTITQVDNDEEQPDAFKLQIQYEDGSFEDDCLYPDNDIYLVDCRSSNDALTEEEVSLSSELLNIHYSLLSNNGKNTKKQAREDDLDDQKMNSTKENLHANIKDRR